MKNHLDDDPSYSVTLITPEGERTVSVGADQHIWDAAQAAGITLPALCHQGHCLTCAGRIETQGEFDQSDSELYFDEDYEAGFILLCTARPCSNLRIRTHRQHEMRDHRRRLGLPAPYA
jgi:ferredoxin